MTISLYSPLFKTSINDVFKTTQLGSLESAISTAMYGINHRFRNIMLPSNQDASGLTLFTRLDMNMGLANLRQERLMSALTTPVASSYARMFRLLFDPSLGDSQLSCPLIDQKSAFMPLLTNTLLSCTGWPDYKLDVYESKRGMYKEQWAMPDDNFRIFSTFDVTCTFKNIPGDPVSAFFYYWLIYMSNVHEGIMIPKLHSMILNEKDYETRIWRIILDKNRRNINKIATTGGGAFPTAISIGQGIDFDVNKPITAANDQVTVQFKSQGFCYNDPILLFELNDLVTTFNPDMDDAYRKTNMVRIPESMLDYFNNTGYPRIDVDNGYLDWYIETNVYEARLRELDDHFTELGFGE